MNTATKLRTIQRLLGWSRDKVGDMDIAKYHLLIYGE